MNEINLERFLSTLRLAVGPKRERASLIARRTGVPEGSILIWLKNGTGPDARLRKRIALLCESFAA